MRSDIDTCMCTCIIGILSLSDPNVGLLVRVKRKETLYEQYKRKSLIFVLKTEHSANQVNTSSAVWWNVQMHERCDLSWRIPEAELARTAVNHVNWCIKHSTQDKYRHYKGQSKE